MISMMIAASLASAQPAEDPFIFGIGNEACASAVDPERSLERDIWIMGYWSGLNVASKRATGKGIDVFGIFLAVDEQCAAQPNEMLMQAVYDVWLSMQPRTGS